MYNNNNNKIVLDKMKESTANARINLQIYIALNRIGFSDGTTLQK